MNFDNNTHSLTVAPPAPPANNNDRYCWIYDGDQHQHHHHHRQSFSHYNRRHYHHHHHRDSQWSKTLSPLSSSSSIEDSLIQRQRQLLLKQGKIQLTHEQQRLFLLSPSEDGVECNYDDDDDDDEPIPIIVDEWKNNDSKMHINISNDCNFRFNNNSNNDVLHTNINDGVNQNRGHQSSNNISDEGYVPNNIGQQQQQLLLRPRDDQRSRVRFTPVLSVYRHYDDDGSDADDDETSKSTSASTTTTTSTIKNNNNNNDDDDDDKTPVELFRRNRACRCWYSKAELRIMKDERKSTIHMLKKLDFVADSIDQSIYTLRGLEPYHSLAINEMIHKKRKEVWESVRDEQCRQESLSSSNGNLGSSNSNRKSNRACGNYYHTKRNVDSLRITSMKATEWTRNRAFEIAKSDASEAARIHRQHHNDDPRRHHHHHYHDIFSPMIVCDDGDGHGHGHGHGDEKDLTVTATTTTTCTTAASLHESFGLMDIDDCGDGSDGSHHVHSDLSYWADSSWTKRLMGDGIFDGKMNT